MSNPQEEDKSHSIVNLTVAVVALAIVIITALTITAIWNGPPI